MWQLGYYMAAIVVWAIAMTIGIVILATVERTL